MQLRRTIACATSATLLLNVLIPHAVSGQDDADDVWASPSSDVLQLTKSNFAPTVYHSGKNGMVAFIQKWCGHSIKLIPVWEQLAKEAHPSIFIANVDCGSDNDICRSSQITSYPTFRYFIDGAEYEYQDARSLEALREFIETTLTVQCNPIVDATTCSEKARKYGDKWISKDQSKLKSEIDRLDAMMTNSGSTTAELRSWMRERRGILTIIHQH
eukprot:scaffold1992_cov203-Alexandrium_tamarense.AAC.9